MRRSLVAALLTFAMLNMPGAPTAQAAGQKRTDSLGQLQIFTVNIHLFKQTQFEEGSWRTFVNRATNPDIYEFMPDIIVVQEISKGLADNFVSYLSRKAGATYRFKHAQRRAQASDGAKWRMVVWRSARLELATGNAANDVLRWDQLGLSDSGRCEKVPGRLSIAARLNDKALDQTIAAASVHWAPRPPGSADKCDYPNMRRTERLLENKWGRRDMTVVGGDFNDNPQEGETENDGMETNPDCWYRNVFGEYDSDDQDRCGDGPLSYYDPVYLAHSTASGPPAASICDQWTHAHDGGPNDSDSCRDKDGDGSRDKNRIDFLWVRWETNDGNVERPSLATARGRVALGRADQASWPGARYSDHRAVVTRVTP